MRDVRMIQRRQHFGFTLEARQAIGIVREGVGQHLDRDVAASRLVSVARYTSPMPPAPMRPVISYGPSRVPGCQRHQFVGTRRFSSSSQLRTTTISFSRVSRIMRKRLPFGSMS